MKPTSLFFLWRFVFWRRLRLYEAWYLGDRVWRPISQNYRRVLLEEVGYRLLSRDSAVYRRRRGGAFRRPLMWLRACARREGRALRDIREQSEEMERQRGW